MKKKFAVAALSLLMVMGSTATVFSAGSIGHGNISVFEDGQLVDRLSGQNPIAESSLLVCDGKCMVKSEGISLVAADQAKFAIQNEDAVFNLFIRAGKIDYVINDNSRKIAFHTPEGNYTIAEVIFNASSSSLVRGSVMVSETGATEIAVTEGRLVFATADGMKTVDANHKIVLAMAGVEGAGTGGAGAMAAGADGAVVGGLTGGMVIGGGISAVAIIAGAAVATSNSNDATSNSGTGTTPVVTTTPATTTTPVVVRPPNMASPN